MSDTVRVSRTLLLAALADAIDWTESLAEAERGARRKFTPAPATMRRLTAYQREYERLTGHTRNSDIELGGTPVSLTDLIRQTSEGSNQL